MGYNQTSTLTVCLRSEMLSTRLLSPLRHSVAAVRMGEPQDTVETVVSLFVVSVRLHTSESRAPGIINY